MSTAPGATAAPDSDLPEFSAAVAADLDLLAALHDRPLTPEVVAAGREFPIAGQLALELASPSARAACDHLDRSLAGLPGRLGAADADALAADHADVYYRFAYRASPTESVWLTEDGLERQAPMFAVQRWYRRHQLRTDDADQRPDDHIVLELGFVAHLVEQAGTVEELTEAARFLDEHPLLWVHQFAERLEASEAPSFYVALAALTAAYLAELREHLAEITGLPRPLPVAPEAQPALASRQLTCGDPDEKPFVPGIAPSW